MKFSIGDRVKFVNDSMIEMSEYIRGIITEIDATEDEIYYLVEISNDVWTFVQENELIKC